MELVRSPLGAFVGLAADVEKTPLNLESGGNQAAAGGGSIVRTIVGLAIVIGVIYGVYWVLKQVKASREESASGTGLDSLATLPLGPNRSLHLVRAGREIVLIGSGEHGVTPIRAYDELEAQAAGLVNEPPVYDVEAAVEELPALPAPSVKTDPNGFATPGAAAKAVLDNLRARTVRR